MENLQKITLTNGQTHILARNEALAYKVEDFVLNETRIAFEDGGQEFPLLNSNLLAYVAYGREIYSDKTKRIIPIYGDPNDIRRLIQEPNRLELRQIILSEICYFEHVLESRCNGERKFIEMQLADCRRQLASLPICRHCQTPLDPETRLPQWKPGELFVCPKCKWTVQRSVLEVIQND